MPEVSGDCAREPCYYESGTDSSDCAPDEPATTEAYGACASAADVSLESSESSSTEAGA